MPRSNLRSLSKRFRRFPMTVRRNVAAAEMATAEDARRLAIVYSSGSTTLVELAAVGHPYSHRAPQPDLYPAAFINRQGGLFVSSWAAPAQSIRNGIIQTNVVNTSPEAMYLQGTSKMVARPIGVQVMADLAVLRDRRLRDAVQQSIRQF